MSAEPGKIHNYQIVMKSLPVIGFVIGLLICALVLVIKADVVWIHYLLLMVTTLAGMFGREMLSRYNAVKKELASSREQLDNYKYNVEEIIAARTQELEGKNKALEELAITDPLTRLYNRRYFQHVLRNEMDRFERNPTPLSLLMFDIDHFKQINDSYGHHSGDIVLSDLVDLIQQCVRKTDVFARWGGEEFMILLPGTTIEGAEFLAEKLRRACANHKFEIPQQVTISIGIAQYQVFMSAIDFTKQTDQALYFAKQKGRNRIEAA